MSAAPAFYHRDSSLAPTGINWTFQRCSRMRSCPGRQLVNRDWGPLTLGAPAVWIVRYSKTLPRALVLCQACAERLATHHGVTLRVAP